MDTQRVIALLKKVKRLERDMDQIHFLKEGTSEFDFINGACYAAILEIENELHKVKAELVQHLPQIDKMID